jgi:uncharacterized protein
VMNRIPRTNISPPRHGEGLGVGLMNTAPRIHVPCKALAEFCRHHIKRLAFFGSVLRDDFGPDSDIDVLYEFEEGRAPGWEIVDIIDELSQLLGGRKIDFVSYKYISPRLKKLILAEAQVQYDAA